MIGYRFGSPRSVGFPPFKPRPEGVLGPSISKSTGGGEAIRKLPLDSGQYRIPGATPAASEARSQTPRPTPVWLFHRTSAGTQFDARSFDGRFSRESIDSCGLASRRSRADCAETVPAAIDRASGRQLRRVFMTGRAMSSRAKRLGPGCNCVRRLRPPNRHRAPFAPSQEKRFPSQDPAR